MKQITITTGRKSQVKIETDCTSKSEDLFLGQTVRRLVEFGEYITDEKILQEYSEGKADIGSLEIKFDVEGDIVIVTEVNKLTKEN